METNDVLLHEFLSKLDDLEVQNLFQKVIQITGANTIKKIEKSPRFPQTLIIIAFVSSHKQIEETLVNKLNEARKARDKMETYIGHSMYYQIICTMLDIIIHSDELKGAFEAELQELQTQLNGEKTN